MCGATKLSVKVDVVSEVVFIGNRSRCVAKVTIVDRTIMMEHHVVFLPPRSLTPPAAATSHVDVLHVLAFATALLPAEGQRVKPNKLCACVVLIVYSVLFNTASDSPEA